MDNSLYDSNLNEKKKVDTNLKKKIGKNIHLARMTSNYTQEQLAEKTGLSVRYISQLERGLAFGSPSTIVCLCNALNVNPDFLFSNVIDSTTNAFSSAFSDDTFMKYYLQLNDQNKKFVGVMTEELVKQQEKNES